MKKWMLLILALLMTAGLALGLTGCGGESAAVTDGDDRDGKITLTCYNCTDSGEPLIIISSGAAGERLEIAPRMGYRFLGMTNAISNGQQMVSSDGIIMYELPGDTALYAQWSPLTYVKRFEVGELGELEDNEPMNITAGTAVRYLPEPEVQEGYQFVGWYSPAAGKVISDGGAVLNEYSVVDAVSAPFWFEEETLTAVIELIQYTVTLDYNDGNGNETTVQVGHGFPIGQLEALADDPENGVEFGGWSTHSQLYQDYLQDESLQAVTEDVTLYAYWRFYKEVTFIADEVTLVSKVYEDEDFLPPDPGIPGKAVEGWYSSELFNTRPMSSITYYNALDTYYGKTGWATYTVTYVTGDDTQLPNGSYTMHSELELPVLSREHATFIGWCRNEDLSDRPLTRIAVGNYGNVTLYAKFVGDPKTVVLNAGGGTVKQNSVTVEYGASYTLPVPQYSGYAFVGWFADEAMTQPLTDENGVSLAAWTQVNEQTQVYAKYLKKYYVTVNVSTPGAATYELKPYYIAGETVELSVALSDEFIMDGIYSGSGEECLSRSTSYSFTMPENNVSLMVMFHRLGSIKLVVADPQYDGYVSCVTMAKDGDTVYLDYDESCEYEVSKLLVNGMAVDISKELCFVMPQADVTLEVEFGPKQARDIDVGDTGLVLYQHNGHLYAIVPRDLTWADAQAYCQFYGGHLVTITSQEEMDFINDLRNVTNMQQKRLWIGASDLRTAGVWEWVTGETFDYAFWASGEPNTGSEHCVEIYIAETGEWNNHTANTAKYFICEWENSSAPQFGFKQEVTPYTGEPVSVNAFHYNGHYYALFQLALKWEDAERFCESIGGHLVTLASEGENQFIAQLRKIYSPNKDIWLGGSDAEQEGVWKWVTGEAFGYTAWHSGEPNGGSKVNYVQLYNNFAGDTLTSWADEAGSNTDYFVCEWDNIYSIGSTYFGNYYNMISSPAQFMEALGGSKSTEGREYLLTADIDLSGYDWTPKDFPAVLDGNGHTIKNLTVKQDSGNVAMFLKVSGTIKDLVFENLKVESTAQSGVLVGGICTELTGTLQNIEIKSGSVVSKESTVGGLVGKMTGGQIIGCTNRASITGQVASDQNYGTGGIVGIATGGTVKNCVNYGAISGGAYTGGIIGSTGADSTLDISNLTNFGAVTASGDCCGGIVGYYERDLTCEVLNLKNEAAITGVSYVGGLFGKLYNNNTNSVRETSTMTMAGLNNSGKITASGDYAGGLAGYLYANDYGYHSWTGYDGKFVVRMTDAVNTGDVTGQYYVGGLLGYGYTDTEESVLVSGSSCCKVTATAYVGGIAGQLEMLHLTAPSNAGSTVTATGAKVDGTTQYALVGGYVGSASKSNITDAVNEVTITYKDYQCLGGYVGGICGSSSGTFTNCVNRADVIAPNSDCVGGIAGQANKTFTYTSTNLQNTGKITGKNQVGGIFGRVYNHNDDKTVATYTMTLDKLTNSGAVIASGDYVGGLVGYLYAYDYGYHSWTNYDGQTALLMTEAVNTGNVTGQYYVGGLLGYGYTDTTASKIVAGGSSADITAAAIVGGIAGKIESINLINPTNAGSTLTVTGTLTEGDSKYAYVGGYLGYGISSDISDAVNDMAVTYEGYKCLGAYVGGIAGRSSGTFTNCTNNGRVKAPNSDYVGGIAGCADKTYTYTCKNLKNTVKVNGKNQVGGIFGRVYNYNSDGTVATYTMTLEELTNTAAVVADGNYAGGLIGYLYAYDYGYHSWTSYDGNVVLVMTDAFNSGKVTGQYYVGGLLGYGYTDTTASQIIAGSSSGDITAEAIAGCIAGKLEYINLLSPSNTGSTMSVTGALTEGDSKYAYVGGYVGYAVNSDISDASNGVVISYDSPLCLGDYVGGICGSSSGNFTGCTNRAQVKAPNSNYVGGIAGQANKTYTYTSASLKNIARITGKSQVGGIFGRVYNYNSDGTVATYTMTLEGLSNSGAVIASGEYAGGLIGYLYAYDYGYHSWTSYDGKVTVYLSASTNTGSVTGTRYVGTLMGYAYTDSSDSMIYSCTSTGKASEGEDCGGFVGKAEGITEK